MKKTIIAMIISTIVSSSAFAEDNSTQTTNRNRAYVTPGSIISSVARTGTYTDPNGTTYNSNELKDVREYAVNTESAHKSQSTDAARKKAKDGRNRDRGITRETNAATRAMELSNSVAYSGGSSTTSSTSNTVANSSSSNTVQNLSSLMSSTAFTGSQDLTQVASRQNSTINTGENGETTRSSTGEMNTDVT
ncbi:MAG TPA: hypothetical protein VIY47_01780, partial [Ignavibacteriaceae bacterium]